MQHHKYNQYIAHELRNRLMQDLATFHVNL